MLCGAQDTACASGLCQQGPVLLQLTSPALVGATIAAGSCAPGGSSGAGCELECVDGYMNMATAVSGLCQSCTVDMVAAGTDCVPGTMVYHGQNIDCTGAVCPAVEEGDLSPFSGETVKTGTCGSSTIVGSTGPTEICELECAAGWKASSDPMIGTCQAVAGTSSAAWAGQSIGCTECETGKYQAASGGLVCADCPVGQYQEAVGQISCISCGVGQYQHEVGQSSCIGCEVGNFNSDTGVDSCTPCAAGQYQSVASQGQCLECSPGAVTQDSGSQHTVEAAVMCVPCGAGQFSAQSSSPCAQCDAGQYQNTQSQTSCIGCVPGQYAAGTGLTACSECSIGQSQSSDGETGCVDCSTGRYQSGTGEADCLECSPGSVTQINSQTTDEGGTTCVPCGAGQFSAQSSSPCAQCDAGQYQDSVGVTDCTLCPDGQTSVADGTECQLSLCAAVSISEPRKIIMCEADGSQAGDGAGVSECHLGCEDGYAVDPATHTAGACLPDASSATASYQGQHVDCLPGGYGLLSCADVSVCLEN